MIFCRLWSHTASLGHILSYQSLVYILWFLVLCVCSCVFFLIIMVYLMFFDLLSKQWKKGWGLGGWRDGEDLGGVKGGKSMIRVCSIKIIFHIYKGNLVYFFRSGCGESMYVPLRILLVSCLLQRCGLQAGQSLLVQSQRGRSD